MNSSRQQFYDDSKTTFDSEPDGVYIIIKGACKIVNRFDNLLSANNSKMQNLNEPKIFFGDCFGEFETLKVWDYTVYGDIYVSIVLD